MTKRCEDCRFWTVGDASPKKIGNVGICSALMPHTAGFYDRNLNVPFWAQDLAHQTTSYQGVDCGTWKRKAVSA